VLKLIHFCVELYTVLGRVTLSGEVLTSI
jgi:hypothetical protein